MQRFDKVLPSRQRQKLSELLADTPDGLWQANDWGNMLATDAEL
ncbi:MAG: hypothetical protein Q7U38_18555 [Methylobacter sp.]|nr:hypothetical protein [Methylobacter sp.]MDP2099725.1 hypothetical protein [Methylobacter sp.]MDP2430359.1 hypothetical protein [Methylobacter sp.]MDP3053527.1 hypothetical protein [Methylobacter sp.]MDP3362706.1 hypothetical protein [Methylobacter sp.]